jgi:hypothetical protein
MAWCCIAIWDDGRHGPHGQNMVLSRGYGVEVEVEAEGEVG